METHLLDRDGKTWRPLTLIDTQVPRYVRTDTEDSPRVIVGTRAMIDAAAGPLTEVEA